MTINHPLILFDIDGTLLRGAPPVHRQALCAAALAIYGARLTPEGLGQTAGMTDCAIARRALRATGIGEAAIAAGWPAYTIAAAEVYERLAPERLDAYHTPHAAPTLDWLLERGATLGLVTGNIERIAWRKLAAARLAARFIQPALVGRAEGGALPWVGGFGDDAEDRAALPPLALARATALLGATPPARATWVIGDTPADIACGVAHGLRVVAVATGLAHSHADLLACAPDYALHDLSEINRVAFE